MSSNISVWWFRVRGPNSLSHVKLWSHDHVKNAKNRYITTSAKTVTTKIVRVITISVTMKVARVVTWVKGPKLPNHLRLWSNDHARNEKYSITPSTKPMSLKTAWKVSRYGTFSDLYFYFIQSRKIRTRKKSVFGHFYAVQSFQSSDLG